MKIRFQPWAAFKWCSATFAMSKFIPAELETSFPWLIFISATIDFNDSVNRHTPPPLSASSSLYLHQLQPPYLLSSHLLLCTASLFLFFFLFFLLRRPPFKQQRRQSFWIPTFLQMRDRSWRLQMLDKESWWEYVFIEIRINVWGKNKQTTINRKAGGASDGDKINQWEGVWFVQTWQAGMKSPTVDGETR